MAAGFVFMVLLLAMAGHSSATWCICRDGQSDATLQKTLDYACGAGADCNPTHQSGPCYNPNTVRAHCSYAVNSYFQKNRQVATACDFSGTATVVTSDPSVGGCAYPATASTTTTPVSGMPTTTVNGGSPLVTTPSSGGVLGGSNNGLGPSGINTDISHAWAPLPMNIVVIFSVVVAFSALVLW